MDLVVSSTLALDATHDVEWYVTDFVGSIFSDDLRFTSLSSGDAQDMYVLALVTQKGGSGKSTLAVGLAVAAMENGERVAFVEADPQGTISKWKERRGNPYPRVVRVADSAEIDGALSRLEAEGIWLGIIDTAATNNALAMHAIARTDLCLIPVRPSPADIEAAIPTLIAIRRLNRRFAFVLNQTPPRGCRLSEAATSLNSLGVLALPYVGQRNDHQDALGVGLGVTEFAQGGGASEEIRELWRWVLKKLVEGSFDHEQNANRAAS
jgi:chromosome partitioning protein